MTIDPTLTKSEIETKIAEIETKLDNVAEVGDSIRSAGTAVEYNNRYNHFKRQLEQLYAMKSNLVRRGEW